MAEIALDTKEPSRWAFWRYGYLAYRMIREHQMECLHAHAETKATMERTETKVDEVLSTVKAFVEMQPELKTSITRARDRKAVGAFITFSGKIVAGILTAFVAVLTIGVWLVPYVRAWLGIL